MCDQRQQLHDDKPNEATRIFVTGERVGDPIYRPQFHEMTMLTESKYRPYHGAWTPLGSRLKPPRVLVADDEPHILRLVALELERAGFDVVTAVDGPQAIEAVFDREPDLCVLDVGMPGCSGWDVLQDIRTRDYSRDLRVIMLTALASDADLARGYDLGADSYVTKPIIPRRLVEEVRGQLALS